MAQFTDHFKLINPEVGRDKAIQHLEEVEDDLNVFIDELLDDN